MIEKLIVFSTYLLAVSIATERLVAFVKTLIPWLAKESVTSNGLVNQAQERWRLLVLQLLAFLCAFITTALLNEFTFAPICMGDAKDNCWPVWLIALLSSGGSAFWSNLLGYANAVKDVKKQERAQQRMALTEQAQQRGISAKEVQNF